MGTWQGKITSVIESVPSNVHAPIEMDRINSYLSGINLDVVGWNFSTPLIDTLTYFTSSKLGIKSTSATKYMKFAATSLSYDITVSPPGAAIGADNANLKLVLDDVVNQFLSAQKFDKEVKIKPITVPSNDATYGQLYADSADSNRLKFKKPDNSVIAFPESIGGSSTHVQYNDSGVLGGEAAFAYDKTNNELTVPGIDVQEDLKISAVLSPAQITGNQNNYSPTDLDKKTIIRLDVNAERTLTGIVPTVDHRVLELINISSYKIYFSKEDAASTATNRFDFHKDLVLLPKHSMIIWYDTVADRWKLMHRQSDILVLDKTTVNTTVSNSLSETSIHSVTIPANYLNNNGMIRVTIYGEYLNNSGGSADFKLNIEYNTVSMWRDQSITVGTHASKRAVVFEFILAPDNNSASAQVVFGKAIISDPNGALAGFGDLNDDEVMSNTSFGGNASETTTTDKTLNILVQHSVQNANISFTKKLALIEYIP